MPMYVGRKRLYEHEGPFPSWDDYQFRMEHYLLRIMNGHACIWSPTSPVLVLWAKELLTKSSIGCDKSEQQYLMAHYDLVMEV